MATTTRKTGEQLLEELIAEVNAADPQSYTPRREDGPKDTLIGVIEDPVLQKLYTLGKIHELQEQHLLLDANAGEDGAGDEAEHAGLRAKIFITAFWLLTRRHFNSFNCCLSIRKGWKIVNDGTCVCSRNLHG